MPEIVARAMTAPGWAAHLKGVDPKSVTSRARAGQAAAVAQIRSAWRCRKPVRRSAASTSRRPAKQSGCICRRVRSSSRRATTRILAARPARCSPPASAPATWCITRSRIISRRAPTFSKPARTRSAAPPSPAASATPSSSSRRSRISSRAGYIGTPDFLKILLDTAEKSGKDASSIKRGLVSGAALPATLREELRGRGVAVLQCYAIAETGVIAYESDSRARRA